MGIHDLRNDYDKTTSYMNYVPGKELYFGDIVSSKSVDSKREIRIGLISTSYFEFWHQYPDLLEKIKEDAEVVYRELDKRFTNVIYPGLVDTIDKAIDAGKKLRDENIDVLILAYRAYIPDSYIHHLLSYIEGIPILMLVTQDRSTLKLNAGYCEIYRTSGMMAQVQLVAGLRKMGLYRNKLEAIAGSIYEAKTFEKVERYIRALKIFLRLKHMTLGVIGNVFRGMNDFEFDKTKVKGTLGPEVINVSIELLKEEYDNISKDDPDIAKMYKSVRETYIIEDCGEQDLEWAVMLSVALERIVKRFSLDGIALLGQHYIEKLFKTEPYLAINELEKNDICIGVTEGDVIGLITMIILKNLTGNTPFMLEYSEFDIERNAMLLLGHGHADPREARGKAVLGAACEHWGHEGTGVCGWFVPKPGPCTIAHLIDDADGWKMFLHKGEILDMEPLKINETHAVVRVEEDILEFAENVVKAGIPHHAITVRGECVEEMKILADLFNMPIVEV